MFLNLSLSSFYYLIHVLFCYTIICNEVLLFKLFNYTFLVYLIFIEFIDKNGKRDFNINLNTERNETPVTDKIKI